MSKCEGLHSRICNGSYYVMLSKIFFSKLWDSNVQHTTPVKAMALLCSHDEWPGVFLSPLWMAIQPWAVKMTNWTLNRQPLNAIWLHRWNVCFTVSSCSFLYDQNEQHWLCSVIITCLWRFYILMRCSQSLGDLALNRLLEDPSACPPAPPASSCLLTSWV